MKRFFLPSRTFWIYWFLCQLMLAGCAKATDLPDFTHLVEEQGKSVVNISTTQERGREEENSDHEDDQGDFRDLPFQDFFRRFFEERDFGREAPFVPEESSLGSGFILSKDGYILTNAHVIRQAKEITVKLADRREFKATLIGMDEESDLALLKINAQNLPAATLGSSEKLKVGEWVLAIGSPFGFEQSATAGIVSAKGRSLKSERYVPFIQTDVAINPGNSGGPLFNLKGEVVGVNSQILSRTGGYMGVSFAIPIDVAKDIVEQLKKGGKISRGWIGIAFQELTRELSQSFGLKGTAGALVASVVAGSPAEKAGLQSGDVVISYNGHRIEDASDLPHFVGRTKVGEEVTLEVWRRGKAIQVLVKIAVLPEEYSKNHRRISPLAKVSNPLGLVVRNLTQTEQTAHELSANMGGVIVERIAKGEAQVAGIVPGDVILSINQREIKGVDDFNEAMGQLSSGKTVAILLSRKGQGQRYFAVQVPEKSGS